jgi:hypothetical protein
MKSKTIGMTSWRSRCLHTTQQCTASLNKCHTFLARTPKQPIDIIIGKAIEQYDSVNSYGDELVQTLKRTQQRIIEIYQSINQQRMTDIANEPHSQSYNVGDSVWVFNPTVKEGKSRKLTPKWIGPCKITDKRSDVTFIVSDDQGKKHRVHRHRLRRQLTADASPIRQLAYDSLAQQLAVIKQQQEELLAERAHVENELAEEEKK